MSKTKIGIIGFGRFGTLIATILSKYFIVEVFHYRQDKLNEIKAKKIGVKLVKLDQITACEIVVLAIPISKTKVLIKKISSMLKPGALLVDTCSVKALPCEWLLKNIPKNIEIMGTHPMFGPVTTKFNLEHKHFELTNKQIVLCPLRIKKERLQNIKVFLKKLGINVITTTPKDHDKQNAKTLSFVHFLGRSLASAKMGAQKIFTPGYADVLKILPHTNNDDWQLFYDMHNYNPYSKKIRNDFFKACDDMENKLIKSVAIDNLDYERKILDKIDHKIFSLFEKRIKHVEKIGLIKKDKKLKIVDPKREVEIIDDKVSKFNLDKNFIKNIYKLIFTESYKKQK